MPDSQVSYIYSVKLTESLRSPILLGVLAAIAYGRVLL